MLFRSKSEPIIMLSTYQKLDKDNDIVIDNSQDPTRSILLNTKDFEKIEVIYTSEKFKENRFMSWFREKVLCENIKETEDK